MTTITLKEVERDPFAFLQRIQAGEAFLLLRDGQPVAEVKPVAPQESGSRPFGLCAGQFVVPNDFDEPLPDDVLKDFSGCCQS